MKVWMYLALVALVAAVLLTGCRSGAQQGGTTNEQATTKAINLAAKGKYDKADAALGGTDSIRATWVNLTGQLGAYKGITEVKTEKSEKVETVVAVCQFNACRVDMHFEFGADGKVGRISVVTNLSTGAGAARE